MRRWLDARGVAETVATMLHASVSSLAQGITTVRDLGANPRVEHRPGPLPALDGPSGSS